MVKVSVLLIEMVCDLLSRVSRVSFRFAVWVGSLQSLSTKSLIVLPLPPSKTNTSNKAWKDAIQWPRLRMLFVWGWRKSRDASQPVNL